MSSPLSRCAPTPSPRWTSSIILLGALAISANYTVLSIVLPQLAEYFDTSESNVAWVSLAPALTSSAFTTIAGAAADRFGRKRVWIWGFSLNLISLGLCALSPTLFLLVLGRVLAGVGGALDTPSGFALIASSYPPSERGIYIGYLASITNIAPSIGDCCIFAELSHMTPPFPTCRSGDWRHCCSVRELALAVLDSDSDRVGRARAVSVRAARRGQL